MNETQQLLRLARTVLADDENPLDGLDKRKASRIVNKALSQHTKGFFSDTSWQAVQRVWKDLDRAGIDWYLTDNFYSKNREGVPESKTWKFEVKFVNNRGRPAVLYGVLQAAGAGSVDDPLDRYDITAYVS